jgi:signal transduction histidine kinase
MVTGFLKLLRDDCSAGLDGRGMRYVELASDGAQRIGEMITDVLEYSRIGRAEFDRQPLDASKALDEALANLSQAIEAAGAAIAKGTLPPVYANHGQLVRVFQNLVGNALAQGGTQPLRIEIDAERCGLEWRIRVSDNGLGFDPLEADRLFVLFQRGVGARGAGSGIGLAIVKQIIKALGGHVWAESQPGAGASFFFTLPAAELDSTDAQAPPISSAGTASPTS